MSNMTQHAKALSECHDICQETLFQHCLVIGGTHAEPDHVKLMMDCIAMCRQAADFMMRNSSQAADLCALCVELCEACARSCERIGDEKMVKCAEACMRCAKACKSMGKAAKNAA